MSLLSLKTTKCHQFKSCQCSPFQVEKHPRRGKNHLVDRQCQQLRSQHELLILRGRDQIRIHEIKVFWHEMITVSLKPLIKIKIVSPVELHDLPSVPVRWQTGAVLWYPWFMKPWNQIFDLFCRLENSDIYPGRILTFREPQTCWDLWSNVYVLKLFHSQHENLV